MVQTIIWVIGCWVTYCNIADGNVGSACADILVTLFFSVFFKMCGAIDKSYRKHVKKMWDES